jgi:hypothetical protein
MDKFIDNFLLLYVNLSSFANLLWLLILHFKNDMLRQLKTLSDDDYRAFLCQSLDINRPPEVNRAVVKKVMKDGQRNSKLKPIAAASGTSSRGNAMEQPLPSIQQSAWKVDLWGDTFHSSRLIPRALFNFVHE